MLIHVLFSLPCLRRKSMWIHIAIVSQSRQTIKRSGAPGVYGHVRIVSRPVGTGADNFIATETHNSVVIHWRKN